MDINNLEFQNKQLLKALTDLVEHDEYLINRRLLIPFVELERARSLIEQIENSTQIAELPS